MSISHSRIYLAAPIIALVTFFAVEGRSWQTSNIPPVAQSDSFSFHKEIVVPAPGILGNDSDPDGDTPLSARAVAGCAIDTPTACLTFQGKIANIDSDGALHFYAGDFNGTDGINYKVCDSRGACSSPTTITFNVTQRAPVAGSDSYNVSGPLTVPAPGILGNDSDPDGDSISVKGILCDVESPTSCLTRGRRSVNIQPDGAISFSPDSFAGTDMFDYQLCDDLGRCSTGTVTLKVSCQTCNCPAIPIVR